MRKIRPGRLILCVLALLALVSAAAAERPIPAALKVTQDVKIERKDNGQVITRSVLHSARPDVDAAINARVDELAAETARHVPTGKESDKSPPRGDTCTQITRTGERWMSFHICAQASADDRQLWVKSEEYTYDMETGRLILLGEIISEEGWEPLLREVRTQLENHFPAEDPVGEELDAICSRENLEGAGFVMTPGHLALYFPAGGVYPAHEEALLRAEIYVPALQEILTEEARQETDCTGYSLVALTYDDGPLKGRSREVRNASVRFPAQLTFFLIGGSLKDNTELVHLEYDSGHSVQSHGWIHEFDQLKAADPDQILAWEKQFNETLSSIIGVNPVMMRPPGGEWGIFTKAGSQMPMILWNKNSGDGTAGDADEDMYLCYYRTIGAEDGNIILCHDRKSFYGRLADQIMENFAARNVLLVTVDDLCALRGVPLEAGLILKGWPEEVPEE